MLKINDAFDFAQVVASLMQSDHEGIIFGSKLRVKVGFTSCKPSFQAGEASAVESVLCIGLNETKKGSELGK